jgi:hypothetical protein
MARTGRIHAAPQRHGMRWWRTRPSDYTKCEVSASGNRITELSRQCPKPKARGVAQSVSHSTQLEWSFRCRRRNTPMTSQRFVRIRCTRIEDGKWDSRPWWVPLCKAIARHCSVAYTISLCNAVAVRERWLYLGKQTRGGYFEAIRRVEEERPCG